MFFARPAPPASRPYTFSFPPIPPLSRPHFMLLFCSLCSPRPARSAGMLSLFHNCISLCTPEPAADVSAQDIHSIANALAPDHLPPRLLPPATLASNPNRLLSSVSVPACFRSHPLGGAWLRVTTWASAKAVASATGGGGHGAPLGVSVTSENGAQVDGGLGWTSFLMMNV
eukprot:TRINITY_DN12637_c0_g1_i1.p2 TRINITY_DN12637_c0_g1~~TRINITY_DN12637_c0_g1_i1.p2  ORF type:complete len:171 (-),score=8.99 TRINITY_DN12637_c0_g1_i1:53-565(-)